MFALLTLHSITSQFIPQFDNIRQKGIPIHVSIGYGLRFCTLIFFNHILEVLELDW